MFVTFVSEALLMLVSVSGVIV